MCGSALHTSSCLQTLSCGVLVVAAVILVQNETLSSTDILPAQVSPYVEATVYGVRGELNFIPVVSILIITFTVFLVSFLGCVGTCLHNRCMIVFVSYLASRPRLSPNPLISVFSVDGFFPSLFVWCSNSDDSSREKTNYW